MRFDAKDRVRVAYKKLKQMVHFEKNSLTLRRRLAEFECEHDFDERLQKVATVATSRTPHETSEFRAWLAEIEFEIIPKGLVHSKEPNKEEGSFVSNVTAAPVYLAAKVNYMFDGPIELHLLSVLWLMTEGAEFDETLSEHCSGSRLHKLVGDEEDRSAHLFKKYHELYAKWRDSGIQKAQDLLTDDRKSVYLVGLDVQEFYYRIQIDWKSLHSHIKRPVQKEIYHTLRARQQQLGANLLKCIEEVCKSYRDKLSAMLAITHPDLPDEATCLPIGLSFSPVIANWYLKDFDSAILEKVRPAYYGRYVDDILMVVATPQAPDEDEPITSFMKRILVDTGILKWDEDNFRFELCSRPGLFLQRQKCVLQFFDAEHSTAGLDKFKKQIENNASAFALLPVDGDDSPVAQVAYNLMYENAVNKFRSVKAVAENRWELAGHLAKQIHLHLMTDGAANESLKGDLFRFFKGRNAIEYWDMWERVLSFLVVSGDTKSAELFCRAMRSEIQKVKYKSQSEHLTKDRSQISNSIRRALKHHLEQCMELSIAVIGTASDRSTDATHQWRMSNLIRHHLVAVPLINYTNYKGNLASPWSASDLVIDPRKAKNSPRFVHFDECLELVESGSMNASEQDSITRANEIYKIFHGSAFAEVTSKIFDEESSN